MTVWVAKVPRKGPIHPRAEGVASQTTTRFQVSRIHESPSERQAMAHEAGQRLAEPSRGAESKLRPWSPPLLLPLYLDVYGKTSVSTVDRSYRCMMSFLRSSFYWLPRINRASWKGTTMTAYVVSLGDLRCPEVVGFKDRKQVPSLSSTETGSIIFVVIYDVLVYRTDIYHPYACSYVTTEIVQSAPPDNITMCHPSGWIQKDLLTKQVMNFVDHITPSPDDLVVLVFDKHDSHTRKFAIPERRDPRKPKVKIGDLVRISKTHGVFRQGFRQNWSAELYKVVRIRHAYLRMFYLEDLCGEPIIGGYYTEEIWPTRFPDVYLVEELK
ncbi:hypothetical protein PR048_024251 [Dryococelus australis]|uniref:Uncharacterized protein n=1 Tax=Dryococelus australis TaxID=614101 RepID=A0ABQ9GN48_9NEOP|nr:hypothetical protein PR048_024251 [Dryococelus australis]